MSRLSRRSFLGSACVGAVSLGLLGAPDAQGQTAPPVRTITRGSKHHWFGYYDKLQFDPSDRYVLSNEVSFEGRTPRADDRIRVGMVDTADNDKWIELGSSLSWGWQQGCMLQWIPKTKADVLWNDRDGDHFVCHVMNTQTRKQHTLDRPIYTISPDGRYGLSVNFARLQVLRPGYGYVGLPDPYAEELAPAEDGVFRVDLKSGASELILPLSEVAKIPYKGKVLEGVFHYFNHLLVSPSSDRFIVLHRWRTRDPKTGKPTGRFTTRMLTVNMDGGEVYVLDPSGHTSHFIWRDPEYSAMWTKPEGKKAAFYGFRDRTREVEIIGDGVMTRNGHNTYVPRRNNEWILNDTYPDGDRNQHVYLYHVPSGKRFALGKFYQPPEYKGEWRCDTHPRSSTSGNLVCIDSPHTGKGRQLHVIDVREILDSV